jgi:hypothetical protein
VGCFLSFYPAKHLVLTLLFWQMHLLMLKKGNFQNYAIKDNDSCKFSHLTATVLLFSGLFRTTYIKPTTNMLPFSGLLSLKTLYKYVIFLRFVPIENQLLVCYLSQVCSLWNLTTSILSFSVFFTTNMLSFFENPLLVCYFSQACFL